MGAKRKGSVDLVALARAAVPAQRRGAAFGRGSKICAALPVVHALRERGLTWKELEKWMAEHGQRINHRSMATCMMAYRKGLVDGALPTPPTPYVPRRER